jgi:hypothetical protein
MKKILIISLLIIFNIPLHSQIMKCTEIKISTPDSFIKLFEFSKAQINMIDNYYKDQKSLLFKYTAEKVVNENKQYKTMVLIYYWKLDLETKQITYVEIPDHTQYDDKSYCNCYEPRTFDIDGVNFESKTVGNEAGDDYETELWCKTKTKPQPQKISLQNKNFHHIFNIYKEGSEISFVGQDNKDHILCGKIDVTNKVPCFTKVNAISERNEPIIQASYTNGYYIILEQSGITGGTNPIIVFKCQ